MDENTYPFVSRSKAREINFDRDELRRLAEKGDFDLARIGFEDAKAEMRSRVERLARMHLELIDSRPTAWGETT